MARKGRRSSNEERIEAIRLLGQGYTKAEVANILNVAESSVYDWQSRFREGGLAALSTKIASGRNRLLTDKQLLQLYKWIRGNPRQVQFDFGLWTRKIVRDLFRREFGIYYSLQNVGKILKMLGFSPQRPVYQALERNEEQRRIWMEKTFPAIKKRAETEGAKIFFADEAGCRTDHHSGRTWSPVGQTPVVKNLGKHDSIGMASAVSMQGAMFWMTYDGSMNSTLFTEFLNLLIHDIEGKIFLIVDNVKYHSSKETSEWTQEHRDRIELFFLPAYSPDLNPDEFVWAHMKTNGVSKKPLKQNESLRRRIEDNLIAIQKNRKLVRSFFRAQTVAYAKD